jgi:hypothetical protein
MAAEGQGQFRFGDGVLLLPNQVVDRLADHPGNRDIALAGERAEPLVVRFVQADRQASFFAVSSSWTAYRMVFIAPLYCSPAESALTERVSLARCLG